MKAEIITIGDEILIGQIIDTNSAWMARELGEIGIQIIQISSIADRHSDILKAIELAETRAELILMTGGLGPTKDDITKKALADYFQSNWQVDEEALENVKNIFRRLSRPMIQVNLDQAKVPDNCLTIPNLKGTAPGMWFEKGNHIYISMPGVPHEMMAMIQNFIIPDLKRKRKFPAIFHQTLLTAGIGESFLAEKLSAVEENLPDHIRLAYLPKLSQVRLRLSGYGVNQEEIEKEVSHWSEKIIRLIGDYLVFKGDGTIAQAILLELEELGKTFALAESCTGGFISKEITAIPGSSKTYLGGLVPYSNSLKTKFLGVKESTLENFGAVSEETVVEMVQGLIHGFEVDFGLVSSGIAGPGGGSIAKPVGTVWLAWGSKNEIHTQKLSLGNDRIINIERASIMALYSFYTFLKNQVK